VFKISLEVTVSRTSMTVNLASQIALMANQVIVLMVSRANLAFFALMVSLHSKRNVHARHFPGQEKLWGKRRTITASIDS
jgi:hypothetical protein